MVQIKTNIEKNTFKVVQMSFLAKHMILLIKKQVMIYLQYIYKIPSWNMIFT